MYAFEYVQGARAHGWLRVLWGPSVLGAPRTAAGLLLGSPGAARGRLRYARLSFPKQIVVEQGSAGR